MGEYNYDEQVFIDLYSLECVLTYGRANFFHSLWLPCYSSSLYLSRTNPFLQKEVNSRTVKYHLTGVVDENILIDCTCEGCENKRKLIATRQKREIYTPAVIRKYILLVIGWSIVGYMSYRIATTKWEHKIWDPYVVLGIPASSSLSIIKSHYKKLSRTFHPDKIKLVGNLTKDIVESKFVDITKAYKAYFPCCFIK